MAYRSREALVCESLPAASSDSEPCASTVCNNRQAGMSEASRLHRCTRTHSQRTRRDCGHTEVVRGGTAERSANGQVIRVLARRGSRARKEKKLGGHTDAAAAAADGRLQEHNAIHTEHCESANDERER